MQISAAKKLKMQKQIVLFICVAFLRSNHFGIEANTVKNCPPTCPFKYFEDEEHVPALTFLHDDKRIKSILIFLDLFVFDRVLVMLGKALRARESLHDLFQDDTEHEEKEVLDDHLKTMNFLMKTIKNTNKFSNIFDAK